MSCLATALRCRLSGESLEGTGKGGLSKPDSQTDAANKHTADALRTRDAAQGSGDEGDEGTSRHGGRCWAIRSSTR
jgi:hypothetical protein